MLQTFAWFFDRPMTSFLQSLHNCSEVATQACNVSAVLRAFLIALKVAGLQTAILAPLHVSTQINNQAFRGSKTVTYDALMQLAASQRLDLSADGDYHRQAIREGADAAAAPVHGCPALLEISAVTAFLFA